MNSIGIDIGGTKISSSVFDREGFSENRLIISISGKTSEGVFEIVEEILTKQIEFVKNKEKQISGIGICIPGIYWSDRKTVWAPNIHGWDDYPLYDKVKGIKSVDQIPVHIDSDRACYILGEVWKGAATGAKNAIYMAVGTGIGLGILVNGEILRGANDIAGATGWLALERPYDKKYVSCGCFEYSASGAGLGRKAADLLKAEKFYTGYFKEINPDEISGKDVFHAYDNKDPIAIKVIENAIELWGMAIANYVSLFNPEIIIMGGGIFGPANRFIPEIFNEAVKWAQPWSINLVRLSESKLGSDAGLYGAGFIALRKYNNTQK